MRSIRSFISRYSVSQARFALFLCVAFFCSIGFISAQIPAEWTPPSENPPFGNLDTPLSTSELLQIKSGALGLTPVSPYADSGWAYDVTLKPALDVNGLIKSRRLAIDTGLTGWVPNMGYAVDINGSMVVSNGVLAQDARTLGAWQTGSLYVDSLATVPADGTDFATLCYSRVSKRIVECSGAVAGPTIVSLTVSGPSAISEGSSKPFTVLATYSNGTSGFVTSMTSNVVSEGSVTPGTVFIAANAIVGDSRSGTLTTSYGGQSATKAFSIVDTSTAPITLSSISITGPASINEGGTGQFIVTGHYSNGTSSIVTTLATYSVTEGTVNLGLVSIPANSTVGDARTRSVSASYGGRNASRSFTVIDQSSAPAVAPVINTFTAENVEGTVAQIVQSGPGLLVKLAWTSSGSNYTCYMDSGPASSGATRTTNNPVAQDGTMNVYPASDTQYLLSCVSNANPALFDTAWSTAMMLTPPTVNVHSFNLDQTHSQMFGANTHQISWGSSGATNCYATAPSGFSVSGLNGIVTANHNYVSTQYTIGCANMGGVTFRSVTPAVPGDPAFVLPADGSVISPTAEDGDYMFLTVRFSCGTGAANIHARIVGQPEIYAGGCPVIPVNNNLQLPKTHPDGPITVQIRNTTSNGSLNSASRVISRTFILDNPYN